MNIKSIIIVIVLFVGSYTYAQQTSQFTQYYVNPYMVNPASGGLAKTLNADFGFRKQWLGIDGSPQTFYGSVYSEVTFDHRDKVLDTFNTQKNFIFESPLNSVGVNKHVFGGSVYYDEVGPFQQANVMASYAFHLRFASKMMMSFGVSAGYSNFGINSSRVVLLQAEDDKYNEFLSNSANQSMFDLNAGITLYGERFQLGISSMHLAANRIKFTEDFTKSRYGRHWFLYGMYDIALGTSDFSLEPHFLLQLANGAPASFNLGARLHIERKYWVNVGFRFNDAVSVGAGLNLGRNLRLGYAYDIGIGKVQTISNSTHEIILGLTFGSKRVVEFETFDEENM